MYAQKQTSTPLPCIKNKLTKSNFLTIICLCIDKISQNKLLNLESLIMGNEMIMKNHLIKDLLMPK